MTSERKSDRRFFARLRGLLLLLVLPGFVAAIYLLWRAHTTNPVWIGACILLLLYIAFVFSAILNHVTRPLQVLANVVAALREDDYSFRARYAGQGDALGDLADEINQFAEVLQSRRHVEIEASALLAHVVEAMNMPLFAFDAQSILRLANPAAARMAGRPLEDMLHQSADQLGLGFLLKSQEHDGETVSLGDSQTPDRQARWMVRRSRFYQNGAPHQLLLLSDVSEVLREEERRAWQRLIRVLTHEVNNSLTPIKSIAGSLRKQLSSAQITPAPVADDCVRGLSIVEERAESLNRFLQSYGQLAKLPSPVKKLTHLLPLLERVCHLESRLSIDFQRIKDIEMSMDAAQIEQALINLTRNAVDAALEISSQSQPAWVGISCKLEEDAVCIWIEDNGPGLTNPANLFVPFYTTKKGGSGIGLILARQIVDLHGGTLTLGNRKHSTGCTVKLRLPIC